MATHSSLEKIPQVEKLHGQVDCDFCFCLDFEDPKSNIILINGGQNKMIFYSTHNLKNKLTNANIKTSDFLDLIMSFIGPFDPLDASTFPNTWNQYLNAYQENKTGYDKQVSVVMNDFLTNKYILDNKPEKTRSYYCSDGRNQRVFDRMTGFINNHKLDFTEVLICEVIVFGKSFVYSCIIDL